MNFAAVLLVVSLVGTGANFVDNRHPFHRVKRDLQLGLPSKTIQQNCVYVDISETGQKTIVCGDPAPSTLPGPKSEIATGLTIPPALAALSATTADSDDPAQQRRAEARTFLDKCLGDKCDKRKTHPVAVVVQPQVRYEPVNCPPVEVCQKPQVQYQPIEIAQKPQFQYQLPIKYPCAQPQIGYYGGGLIGGYGGYGGYGGGSYSGYGGGYGGGLGVSYERSTDGNPPPLRSMETNRIVNDAQAMPKLQVTSPYDTIMAHHRRLNGGRRTRMRPTPVFIPGLTRRTVDVPLESGIEAPDAVRGFLDFEPQSSWDFMPQMQMPVYRNGFTFGQFDPNFNQMHYMIRPEMQNFGRVLQPRSFEEQNFGQQTLDQSSGSSGVEDPTEQKMMSDEQNVQQSSDVATESDSKDQNNNTKPTEYKKLDRVTRN